MPIANFNKLIEIDARNAKGFNGLAWIMASASEAAFRDAKKAVENGLKAAELSNWRDPYMLETLAAAYASAGNFDEAIRWQNKALSFPEYEKKRGKEARQRLQLFRERKPWHEPPPK